MKILRHIGSLAFVLGLFSAVFAGIPWYVMVADDPALPWWLRLAVFCLLGGILGVLMTVAFEQRKIDTAYWFYRSSSRVRHQLQSWPRLS